MNILLIGMMTCGKSTMGKQLAKDIGYGFIDQDIYVENKLKDGIVEKNHISWADEIFKSLHELKKFKNTIISSGGEFGTLTDIKGKFDLIIFLDASLPLISERIIFERRHKPNANHNKERKLVSSNDNINDINNTKNISELYNARRPFYLKNSDITFNYSSNKEQENIYSEILNKIQSNPKYC